MKKKQALKEQGIKLIAKEMWVWHDGCEQDAELAFVALKAKNEVFKYTVKTKDGYFIPFENASETNPNEVKQQFKVGDKVRIIKKVENDSFRWHDGVNKNLGKIGIVNELIDGYPDRVSVEVLKSSFCYLNESLELVDDSPKVGDVGYFYDFEARHDFTVYGKLLGINKKESFKYHASNNGDYRFFSKTPPEIK